MGLLCSCVVFTICYISFSTKKDKTNPIMLYSMFWGIMTFLSSLHLYSYFKVRSSTYLMILCGVVFFAIGSLFGEKIVFSFGKTCKKYTFEFSKKRYAIVIIIALLCLGTNFNLILYSLKNGLSINRIYSVIAQANNGQVKDLQPVLGGVQEQLQQYIGYPLLYLIVAVSIAQFVFNKEKKYLIITAVFFLIRFLTDMKRTILVNIAFMFITYFLLTNKALIEKIGKKAKQVYANKKKMFLLIVTLILLFVITSILRSGDDGGRYSLFYNFYSYYPGSINYLDYRIQNWDNMGIDFTHGFTSLRGLIAPFVAFLELVFKIDTPLVFKNATDVVVSLHSITTYISPNQSYNTYATIFYEFYADGGWIGVILCSLIFGYVSGVYYRRYVNEKSLRNIVNYGFFLSMFILFSNIHINSIVICYVWPLVLERFLYRRKKTSE